MGLGPHAALLLLLASLAGSYLNIPVSHLRGEQIVPGQDVWYFGMPYVIPEVVSRPGTVIAINVGGAVIPGLLSLHLYIRNRLWISGLIATGRKRHQRKPDPTSGSLYPAEAMCEEIVGYHHEGRLRQSLRHLA
jgi:uncharacterized protein DUF1614